MKGRASHTPELIDISLTVSPDIPRWPGSPAPEVRRRLDMSRGDVCNDSTLLCNLHTGTHVDAPLHFVREGMDAAALPMRVLIGPAFVAYLPDAEAVTPAVLDGIPIPSGMTRLLLRTRNSMLWSTGRRDFVENFVALTAEAALWIVDHGLDLVGVDYLSVQRFCDGPETHRTLLAAGVVIIEGLDLSAVDEGSYELICLPVKLANADGAPARTVLRRLPL